MKSFKYILMLLAVIVTLGFGAKYPTAEAKAYDFGAISPHKGEMFAGCECCHGPDPCKSH